MGIEDRCRREAEKIQFVACKKCYLDSMCNKCEENVRHQITSALLQKEREIESLKGCIASCEATISGNKRQWMEDREQLTEAKAEIERLKIIEKKELERIGYVGDTRKCGHFVQSVLSFCPVCRELTKEKALSERLKEALEEILEMWVEGDPKPIWTIDVAKDALQHYKESRGGE